MQRCYQWTTERFPVGTRDIPIAVVDITVRNHTTRTVVESEVRRAKKRIFRCKYYPVGKVDTPIVDVTIRLNSRRMVVVIGVDARRALVK